MSNIIHHTYQYCQDWTRSDNGLLHNEDVPARIYTSGNTLWCINGRSYSFNQWCKELNKTSEEILFLKLRYKV